MPFCALTRQDCLIILLALNTLIAHDKRHRTREQAKRLREEIVATLTSTSRDSAEVGP